MSWAGHILLAAIPVNLDLLVASAALFGVILVGAIAIKLAQRWRQGTERSERVPETAEDYAALYEKGALSKEEYDQIRAHMLKKLRPAPPAAADAPPANNVPTDGAADSGPPPASDQIKSSDQIKT